MPEETAFTRTEWIVGADAMRRLNAAHVAVFGVGGVGSYTAEALCRSGVGAITMVDHDRVSVTNINRQIHALHSTVGQLKVDVMRARLRDINPNARVYTHPIFFLGSDESAALSWDFDYVVDAVDTVQAKVAIVLAAQARGIAVISAMGAGNKLNPSLFSVADIYKTTVCPLAKAMRQALREHHVDALKVVYSTEPPLAIPDDVKAHYTKPVGSAAFVPSVAGLTLAGEVIQDLIKT